MKQVNILKAVVLMGALLVSGQQRSLGCYKSTAGLTLKDNNIAQSSGRCGVNVCFGKAAFALRYKDCYCGDQIPADADKVDDSKCDTGCPGYDKEPCGGRGNYSTIFDTGLLADIPKAKASPSSVTSPDEASSSSTSTSPPSSAVTLPGETVVVTASTTPSSEAPSGGSKPNTAGIAAGVVVGVVAIAGIVGGLFLFMRNRKRRAIEEEHRRNAAVSSFVAGGKPPTSSGGASSFTDTRLDPVMAQRRMSDGSIADNQDYSRRILKVTNA